VNKARFSGVRHWLAARVAGALSALVVCAPAASQEIPIPTFSFYKLEPVKIVEWKAVAQLGASLSTGNTEAQSISGSGAVSRRAGDNKFSGDVALAFARTSIPVGVKERDDKPGITREDEIDEATRTTTQSWSVGARYDRFFAEWNSVYASAGATGDRPAGKRLFAGGQVGYRRVLYHRGKRELAAEVGTDFTRREFVTPGVESIEVISARAFVGYRAEPDPLLGITASVDALTNLNPEAPRVPDLGPKDIDPLGDNRVNAIVSTTVKLSEYGSLGLQFSAHYEQAPAPRPTIDGHPYIGFTPLAKRLDTKTELVLIWRLL
jgi:hypothetical protein